MTIPHAVHHRWSDIQSEAVNDRVARKYVTADRVTIARFELKRGGIVPQHSHENEQVTCLLSGTLKFRFNDQEIVARGGEVVQIPGGIEHAVEVVDDAVVIDIFSPIRQDWIDKTDDYFRAR